VPLIALRIHPILAHPVIDPTHPSSNADAIESYENNHQLWAKGDEAQVQANWLPIREDWQQTLQWLKGLDAPAAAALLRELATARLDFGQVTKLDRALQRTLAANGGKLPGLEPVKLAILASATTSHLPSGIRVAGLRRGLAIEVYEADYGMYQQELMDSSSALYAFRPQTLLLALDARHIAALGQPEGALQLLRSLWRQAKANLGCQVIQQTVMPILPELMGNNEPRLEHSPAAIVARVNQLLRPASVEEGVDLLAIDRFTAFDGLAAWHDPAIWHRSKHEVHPSATEGYGEQVIRLIAAARGRSSKCLVLDLDNTLWGGVIGDDGLDGIVLGQGSGTGEAYLEFQRYAKALSERGIILAVCSKNDEKNALEPFEKHPEMVLKRSDIACFVANWTDKASNLRHIARSLNIGLDSLVFADDNPVERALIRRELPMVAVPELPEDPALYVSTLAAAGYFEGIQITDEDRLRSQLYQANAERERLQENVTDMASYLTSLQMVLIARPFDSVGLTRITQLINKTNQFNLTTVRMTEAQVQAAMADPLTVTLQVRLTDRFGDNGIIAILIARVQGEDAMIDTWLMSCRVLGRKVEEACLQVLAASCKQLGAQRLIGLYKPTEKNGMVREMYPNLGFTPLDATEDGQTRWQLALEDFTPSTVPMRIDVDVAAVELEQEKQEVA
jgi:FkbH-like protein